MYVPQEPATPCVSEGIRASKKRQQRATRSSTWRSVTSTPTVHRPRNKSRDDAMRRRRRNKDKNEESTQETPRRKGQKRGKRKGWTRMNEDEVSRWIVKHCTARNGTQRNAEKTFRIRQDHSPWKNEKEEEERRKKHCSMPANARSVAASQRAKQPLH